MAVATRASRDEYTEFLARLMHRRNRLRRARFHEEVPSLRPLPQRRLEDHTAEQIKVTRQSTVMVRGNFYSVPSQLIGERVEIRVFAEELEVWYASQMIQRMPRLRGAGKHQINYRHVIHSLVRKPGAFAHYRYQQSLFPRLIFRVAYDWLREHCPDSADRQYLTLLELAAVQSEELVAEALREAVECGAALDCAAVRERLPQRPPPGMVTPLLGEVQPIKLLAYDALLAVEAARARAEEEAA